MSCLFDNWLRACRGFLPWRARRRWLARRLHELQRQQAVFAGAAYSVVSGHGPYTLEDALCSAESMQAELSELAEHLAALDVMRSLGARTNPPPRP